MKKGVIDEVIDHAKYLEYSFWAEVAILAYMKGFKIAEVPISHHKRLRGGTRVYDPTKISSIVVKQIKGLLSLRSSLRRLAP